MLWTMLCIVVLGIIFLGGCLYLDKPPIQESKNNKGWPIPPKNDCNNCPYAKKEKL